MSEQKRGYFVLRAGWKATAAGIYGLRLLLTKRCGQLTPRAALALDSWPKELPFDQNHRERKGVGKGVDKGVGKGVDKGVDKFVEKFVKKWKKMENYSYFCGD